MLERLIKHRFLWLALVGGIALSAAAQAAESSPTAHEQPPFAPFFGLAASTEATTFSANQLEAVESRSQQTARINRNLLMGTISILTLFVIFRLLLVWQISRNRKKMARNNLVEGEI